MLLKFFLNLDIIYLTWEYGLINSFSSWKMIYEIWEMRYLTKPENQAFLPWFTLYHAWGTPQVQFANIRMVLCHGLPHLFMSMCRPMYGTSCPKSQLKSTCLTANFGSFFFSPRGNGRKRTKCDQFFCPTSDFFDFCNPCFFNHTFTNDVDFVDKA